MLDKYYNILFFQYIFVQIAEDELQSTKEDDESWEDNEDESESSISSSKEGSF